jgi:YVTN family beta-propeller protein
MAVAATPAQADLFAYVANRVSSDVSVIDVSSRTVVTTVRLPSGANPRSVAITPDATRAYVPDFLLSSISVINTARNAVVATIWVGSGPTAIAITPDGSRSYVASQNSNSVSTGEVPKEQPYIG